MNILAEIEAVESRITELLARVPADLDPTHRAFGDALAEGILSVLDAFELDDLAGADLRAIIDRVLDDVFPGYADTLRQAVAERVAQSVTDTRDLYQRLGIDPPGVLEAVQRSAEAAALTSMLDDGMILNRDELKTATLDVMRRAIASGDLDRRALAKSLAEQAQAAAHTANTQITTSIAAYNQAYRNELATRAELDHFLYFGTIQDTTRPFCRALVGKVFTAEQIDQMSNGMLNPVKVFKGGWNCRHSWVPVDPDWDEELTQGLVDGEPQEIPISADGSRTATIIAPPDTDLSPGSRRLAPAGTPVRDAIKGPTRGTLKAHLDTTLSAIERVHGDGDLPEIPVKRVHTPNKGEYRFKRIGDVWHPELIGLSKSDHPELTLAHEIGHVLDQLGLPGSSGLYGMASNGIGDARIQAWRDAVQASQSYKRLKTLRDHGGVDPDTGNQFPTALLDYYLQSHELWARSYAQYVATRSGNSTLLKQVKDETSKPYGFIQWEPEDFTPIAATIDNLFEALGWLKKL